jgi:hypothetical protein
MQAWDDGAVLRIGTWLPVLACSTLSSQTHLRWNGNCSKQALALRTPSPGSMSAMAIYHQLRAQTEGG